MTAYEVQWPYSARRDGRAIGPWTAGEVVDLDADDADWVGRDSPGVLAEVRPAKSERQKPAVADRQHRGGANRGG